MSAEPIASTETSIIVAVNDNPALVLLDPKRFDQFYDAVKDETDRLVPDLTTEKGRSAIASMAFKVAKTKTAIDAAGKALKEEAQATVTKVDAARKVIRDRLDALKDEVRKPLTEWEVAEEARLASVKALLDGLYKQTVVSADETGAQVGARLAVVRDTALDGDVLRESLSVAEAAKANAIGSLERALQRIEREEADRAELEALRAEAAARAEREQAAEIARLAAEAEKQRQAHEAAAALAAAERAKADLAAAEKRAQDAATAAAEEKARREADAASKAHADALAAEKRRADDAEAARKAQEAAAAAAERAAADEARRKQEAADARAADIEHRGKIMGAAKDAIMALGIKEASARSVVLAITAGSVPAVTIQF